MSLFNRTLILLFALNSAAFAGDVLVNKPQAQNDTRYQYPHELLQLVLDKTETSFNAENVSYADAIMSRDRMLRALVEGKDLHVVAEAAKKEWTKHLLVVRIPIRKGIQGYRLFFINKDDEDALASVQTLDQLMYFPTGSGVSWSTARAMSDAGFNVVFGNNYRGLFGMLERKRFITFGRGVNEIQAEFEAQRSSYENLMIEPKLALHIPLPTYFFVTPQRPDLAERIKLGLEALIDSGEFEAFFLKHHQALMDRFDLSKRKVFRIPNSNLTNADPVDDAKLWLQF